MKSNSREEFLQTINHRQPSRVVVDFGSTGVTGIHVRIVEMLREHFGLEKRPVKVVEPYQMLGEIDDELLDAMNIDVIGIGGPKNMFGIRNEGWKPDRTFWGQEVLFPRDFNYTCNSNGDILIHPEGDTSASPCAMMPKTGFFFDAVDRQKPVDDANLRLEDNLEEFSEIGDEDVAHWKAAVEKADKTRGRVTGFGGTALGDIALVPGLTLKDPKGIRGVEEWYISTLVREDFIRNIYDRQSEIAISNLSVLKDVVGDRTDVVYMCGTDFGTQNSTFCSPETYARLWMPYYKRMNDWIHENTSWKTFKHSCGAVEPLIQLFIDSGFDILNPVQINAAGMEPKMLKKKYGGKLVFWGGGVDTQGVFAFGTPEQVKEQVRSQCDILNDGGGFVFNTIHNIQANVPFENVVAMLEALEELGR